MYEVDPVFRHRDEEVRLHMYILIIFTCSKCSDDICELSNISFLLIQPSLVSFCSFLTFYFSSAVVTSPNGFKIRCHVHMMTRLLLCYRGRLQPWKRWTKVSIVHVIHWRSLQKHLSCTLNEWGVDRCHRNTSLNHEGECTKFSCSYRRWLDFMSRLWISSHNVQSGLRPD